LTGYISNIHLKHKGINKISVVYISEDFRTMTMTNPKIRYSTGLSTFAKDAKMINAEDYEAICKIGKDKYEYIPDDRPIKMYFDIDRKGSAEDYDEDLIYSEEVIAVAKSMLYRAYGEDCDMCISTSNSENFVDYMTKKIMEIVYTYCD
jgi:hypothetical protein